MEVTKEMVITVARENTVELLAPYMREKDPDITQQRIDQLMNLMTVRPDLMEHGKATALEFYFAKFNVCVVRDRNGRVKNIA